MRAASFKNLASFICSLVRYAPLKNRAKVVTGVGAFRASSPLFRRIVRSGMPCSPAARSTIGTYFALNGHWSV